MIRKILFFLFLMSSAFLKAAEEGPEMADTFRDDGKIFVVIAVIAIIFICLALFLFYLERKVARLEKKIEDNRQQ
jgi:hypothetical protein